MASVDPLSLRDSACALSCYWDNYVWLILSASVGYALMLVCIKILSERASVFQITAVRGIVGCIALFGVCCWYGVCLFKPRDKMPLIIARAVTGSVAFVFMAIATIQLPLSESAFMANSYPGETSISVIRLGSTDNGIVSVNGCFLVDVRNGAAGSALMEWSLWLRHWQCHHGTATFPLWREIALGSLPCDRYRFCCCRQLLDCYCIPTAAVHSSSLLHDNIGCIVGILGRVWTVLC